MFCIKTPCLKHLPTLASTEDGAKLLEDKIKVVGNNYVVSFPGAAIARENLIKKLKEKNPNFDESKVTISATYTITADELKEAMKKAGSKYSIGDKDVLLMEVAYEKYRNSVAETLKNNNLAPSDYLEGFSFSKEFASQGDYFSGGTAAEAMFIMTGIKSDDCYIRNEANGNLAPVCFIDGDYQMHIVDEQGNISSENSQKAATACAESVTNEEAMRDEIIEKLIKDSEDGKLDEYAATASFNVSSQEVNGVVYSGGAHAFTIKKVT